MELKLTKDNFEEEVLKSDVPVLVDFWAEWCGPCRMVLPLVERLAQEYEGRAKVGKVNVDDESELAFQYRVSSIPTLFVFKNGEIEKRVTGARPYEELQAMLEDSLK